MHSLRIQHNSIFVKWLFCTSRLINQISRPERYGFVLRRFRQFVCHLWCAFNQSVCSIAWICQYMWVILNSNSACEFVVYVPNPTQSNERRIAKKGISTELKKSIYVQMWDILKIHIQVSHSFSVSVCMRLCLVFFDFPKTIFQFRVLSFCCVYLRFISLQRNSSKRI